MNKIWLGNNKLMISSDESDEEVRVQWPLQPRRPLRPAMASHLPDHERLMPRSRRHVFESAMGPGSLNAEGESVEDVPYSSDSEDSGRAPLSVHSSIESIPQDELVESVLNRAHRLPTSSPRFKDGGRHEEVHVQQSKFLFLLIVILVLILGVCCGLYFNSVYEQDEYGGVGHLPEMHSQHMDTDFEKVLKTRIRVVKQKYPSQKNDTWYQFLAGIKKVTRDQPAQPTSFLLLHTSDAKDTIRCLTEDIARTAAFFLNGSAFVTVEGEHLRNVHEENLKASREGEDNGWLIKKYGPQVEDSRTMIVYDLDKIPATLAQAFHSFCDEVSPLVDKAVYLFTLGIPKYNLGKPVKVAEDVLNMLWSSELSDDIRAPLLTRIAGAVVYVLPEYELPNLCS